MGTGKGRAGMWSRAACVRSSFAMGTMVPQVHWANEKGYPLLIMNPNFD